MKKEELCKKSIHQLRAVARQRGVKCPSALKKQQLIDSLLQIEAGQLEPYFTNMGRPAKLCTEGNPSGLTSEDIKQVECLLQNALDMLEEMKSKLVK